MGKNHFTWPFLREQAAKTNRCCRMSLRIGRCSRAECEGNRIKETPNVLLLELLEGRLPILADRERKRPGTENLRLERSKQKCIRTVVRHHRVLHRANTCG